MKRKTFTLLICLALYCVFNPLKGQMVVDTLQGTGTLSGFLAGAGLSISNVNVNCHNHAAGTFQYSGTTFVMTTGMVLSTGSIFDIPQANTSTSTGTYHQTPGDSDMDALTGFTTYDACILEFDCVPSGDTLLFDFTFASEEYEEFVNSGFNDGFAIWLSGPGLTGQVNVAKLPGGTIVTVDSVNHLVNTSYYVNNANGTDVMFDGYTANITSIVGVQQGQTYHFKIGVADASDGIYDTGVFLQANSFRSPPPTSVAPETAAGLPLFPNPANGSLTVDLSGFSGAEAYVEILDMRGYRVHTETLRTGGQASLAPAGLAPGIYLVRVRDEEKSASGRLVIR